jgi:hypothetical protein
MRDVTLSSSYSSHICADDGFVWQQHLCQLRPEYEYEFRVQDVALCDPAHATSILIHILAERPGVARDSR